MCRKSNGDTDRSSHDTEFKKDGRDAAAVVVVVVFSGSDLHTSSANAKP